MWQGRNQPVGPMKTCKKCKASIPKYSDRCPNCGANLKPVFKKAWFWILIIVLLLLLLIGSCSAAMSKSVSNAVNGSRATETSQSSGATSDSSASASKTDYSNMAIGQTVKLENGLEVTITAVQGGLSNYNGNPITCVSVTYVNNGGKEASFNTYDWKAQDSGGAQRNTAYYSSAQNPLNLGNLAVGGTVSGNLYFDGNPTKVVYFSSVLSNNSNIAWTIA